MSKFQCKYYLLENQAILISSEDSFFMSKKIEVLTPIIMKLIHEGHSYSEIAEDLGLKNEKVIRNLVYRINHPKENSLPKKRGRKPKENLRDYNDEIKRLKMENQLLRDFLSLIGKE